MINRTAEKLGRERSVIREMKKFAMRARDFELLVVPSDSFGCEGYYRGNKTGAPRILGVGEKLRFKGLML